MRKFLLLIIFIITCSRPPTIEDGINWLKSKQNANGSWGDPDKLGFLETIEVINTFIALSETTGVEKGLHYLTNQFPENTDFWARKLSLFARTDRNDYFLLNYLIKRRNEDGGFGFGQGYQSSIWETILSLDALKQTGLKTDELLPSVNFILANQNANGGFGFSIEDSSRTLCTAYCVDILSDLRGFSGVDQLIDRAAEWLLKSQRRDGGFGDGKSTIYETALTWFALNNVDDGNEVRKRACEYIASRRDRNGSWNNSIYHTALALRVMHEAKLEDLRH